MWSICEGFSPAVALYTNVSVSCRRRRDMATSRSVCANWRPSWKRRTKSWAGWGLGWGHDTKRQKGCWVCHWMSECWIEERWVMRECESGFIKLCVSVILICLSAHKNEHYNQCFFLLFFVSVCECSYAWPQCQHKTLNNPHHMVPIREK